MDRLPLSDIISVDEVCLDLDPNCRYALVIQDFYTGNPIDLLSSRRTNDTEPYFMSIPLEERSQVKYLISDMYNPYISWVNRYFPNAVSVIDSFYVIQWITHKLDLYIRELIKILRNVIEMHIRPTAALSINTPLSQHPEKSTYCKNIDG